MWETLFSIDRLYSVEDNKSQELFVTAPQCQLFHSDRLSVQYVAELTELKFDLTQCT